MYFKEYLKQYENDELKIYVDMDGVIADYIVGEAKDYDKKRPLKTNIEKLEEISKQKNVELFILSITRYDEGFNQKHQWLDEFVPFIKKENRVIISRESNNMEKSSILKANYLKNLERNNSKIVLIDDDPEILKDVKELNEDIIVLKDTVLVD